MKLIYGFLLCLFFCLSAGTVVAGVYSWTDENGVRHFTDTPPDANVQQQLDVKHEEVADSEFSHRLYRIKGSYGYCGDRRLPYEKETNPRIKLVNLLSMYKSTRKLKQMHTEQLAGFRKRELQVAINKNMFGNYKPAIKKAKHKIAECECLMAWMKIEIAELEPVKAQIIQEARQAEYEYNEIINRCGLEPQRGIHTDQEAIEWAKCKSKMVKLHNKALGRYKRKKAMEESLRSSMRPDD